MNQRLLSKLSKGSNALKKPIRVVIVQLDAQTYTANAPELGLWCPGFGATPNEAVEDLVEAIGSVADRFSKIDLTRTSDYANTVRRTLQNHIS
jgi:hypothetical protein